MRTPFHTLTLALFLPVLLNAQTNENCATAEYIELIAVSDCALQYTYGDNSGADLSLTIPTCDGTNNGLEDVWFHFNAANNTYVQLFLDATNMTDHAYAVYQGCGGPQVSCNIQPMNAVLVPTTPGLDYYVQVYSNLDYGSGGPFAFCAQWVTPPPPPPANDECTGAVVLSPAVACNFVNGTSNFGTSSAAGSCSGSGDPNDDVWYRFVAPLTPVTITVDGDGSSTTGYDAAVDLTYASSCAGTFNSLMCSNETGPGGIETIMVDLLNPGATYYIRVYDTGSQNPFPGTFRICVQRESGMGAPAAEADAPQDWWINEDGTTGSLLLNCSSELSGAATMHVLDALGRRIGSQPVTLAPQTPISLDSPALSPGGYLLILEHQNGSSAKRFIRH